MVWETDDQNSPKTETPSSTRKIFSGTAGKGGVNPPFPEQPCLLDLDGSDYEPSYLHMTRIRCLLDESIIVTTEFDCSLNLKVIYDGTLTCKSGNEIT